MAKFCTQCGAQVEDTAKFCKKCGAKLAPTQPTEHSSPTVNYQTPNYQQPSNFGAGFEPGAGRPPYQPPYQPPAPHVDLKPNVAGMLCYPLSFITGVLFLVLTPYNRDRFVRFHAWQSIFFGVASLVLSIVFRVFPWPLENMLISALWLVAIGGTVWSMYKAYNNEQFKLPVIGEWAENQASKNTP
jgi:uncharacterized membrane protein